MDEIRERKTNGNVRPEGKTSISMFMRDYVSNDGPLDEGENALPQAEHEHLAIN